jgi:hypothetical protein
VLLIGFDPAAVLGQDATAVADCVVIGGGIRKPEAVLEYFE